MDIVKNITDVIINPLITIFFFLALAYFAYAVAMYIFSDNDKDKANQIKVLLFSILGLAIIASIQTILSFVTQGKTLKQAVTDTTAQILKK
ncbi:MAG: hypothetical protein QM526_02550 [Alphaproteobacteria bacterium]|nr:hypothetical protein [Alphaproteobacteria bacterium]